MIEKTREYDQFVFLKCNRNKISQKHVRTIIGWIKENNKLDQFPIQVNDNFEVFDGQHRLLAAKELGIEIYYIIDPTLKYDDIISMNIGLTWGLADYLNFYVDRKYPEYLKLREFVAESGLPLSVAIRVLNGAEEKGNFKFKNGKFIFNNISTNMEVFKTCVFVVNYIKEKNGKSPWIDSTKFWFALLKLVNHPDFDREGFIRNLHAKIDDFCALASKLDYCKRLSKVYNYHRSRNKIDLTIGER